MKALITACLLSIGLFAGSAHAADTKADCETKATEKKLAGAAKSSFVKKCLKESGGAAALAATSSPDCEKSAADKKLAGAAKNSHLKKCMADEKTAMAKPAVAAKPAEAAKPMAAASGAKK